MLKPIILKKGRLYILDQSLLPHRITFVRCKNHVDVARMIKNMQIRGAPLLGIAAAYAFAISLRERKFRNEKEIMKHINCIKKSLCSTRPTARNLFWAIEEIYGFIESLLNKKTDINEIIKKTILKAKEIHNKDIKINKKIGEIGQRLLLKDSIVMTHCNAGTLATGGYGTALGVIRSAYKKGKIKKVIVNETRPYLQGARLTMFELMIDKIPAELITDNMAGYVMRKEGVSAVIVGADRIAANGDVANKIGTYSLAILSKYHKIPFYVAAPTSTIDLNTRSGDEIIIEEREEDEVKKIYGKYITLEKAKAKHYAFDITPRNLITKIITEKGLM